MTPEEHQSHTLGDCPQCGAALVPYRFTHKNGDILYGIGCDKDLSHHHRLVLSEPPATLRHTTDKASPAQD